MAEEELSGLNGIRNELYIFYWTCKIREKKESQEKALMGVYCIRQ